MELNHIEEKMNKTISVLQEDFSEVRAGRANPAILNKIRVDYYGTQTPINQIAGISVPEARLIVIQPWDISLLKEIEKENPDILLIAGDFVDDGTTKEDMIASCEALGKINIKYGIYFAHGNHDKGYYYEKRGYSAQDLEMELTKNNVKVLKDESVLINDEIYIIGRKDAEDRSRMNAEDLTKDLDKSKFMIDINHQPTDYYNESKSNIDLVVSGHTHGGQMIPLQLLSTHISENDSVYGYEKINNTNFIVTSGISDWELKIKTGCKSEYVFININ